MKYARGISVGVAILAVAAGFACYKGWWTARGHGQPAGGGATASAAAADQGGLHVLGWLEPRDGLIDVNGLPGDQLEALLVAEDTVVVAGQPLARLESRRMKQLQVDALQAQVAEAISRREAEVQLGQTRVETAKLGIEKVKAQELEAASLAEKIELLKDNLALAEKDCERLRALRAPPKTPLLPDPLISDQEFDRQQLAVHHAKTELATAQAELKRLQVTQELSTRAAAADLKAAQASKDEAIAAVPVKSLQSKEEIARLELALTEVKAPSAGRVLTIFMRAGETIGQKPILRMANLDQMVAVAEVYEVDVKQVHVGQAATIRSKAFHAPRDKDGLRGQVVRIGRTVNTPELKSLNPFARADRHVIPIRIEIAVEDCAEAAQFVDLQVDVELHDTDPTPAPQQP